MTSTTCPTLYDIDALYLEPYNPPHSGSLLIHAYLKDYLSGKDDITLDAKRAIEGVDGKSLAVEWTVSCTAGGRRWSNLPRPPSSSSTTPASSPTKRDYS